MTERHSDLKMKAKQAFLMGVILVGGSGCEKVEPSKDIQQDINARMDRPVLVTPDLQKQTGPAATPIPEIPAKVEVSHDKNGLPVVQLLESGSYIPLCQVQEDCTGNTTCEVFAYKCAPGVICMAGVCVEKE